MVFLKILLYLLSLLLLIPSIVLFLECLAALFPPKNITDNLSNPTTTAVLIPAHDEAQSISTTIAAILPQLKTEDTLLVVADNCNDNTAAIARESGATVIERNNTQLWGKGYAVDYGLQYLEANAPQVVVFVDADCELENHTIDTIATLAHHTQRPVQATYLMEKTTELTPRDAISTLAVTVKNLVRPIGLNRLGLPCLLMGSGMAFPWQLLKKLSLAHGKANEDIQLGIDAAVAGFPPLYCPHTTITGRLMEQQSATRQRSRWEHAHIETLLDQALPLLGMGVSQRRLDLIAIALELSVPPLSLLVILWWVVTLITVVATYFGLFSWIPLSILVMEGLLIFMAIFLAWRKYARRSIPLTQLLSIPLYIMWKIPLYIGFVLKRQSSWSKNERG